MGKGKKITFLIAKIILAVLTALYLAFFVYLAVDSTIEITSGHGWAALGFVLLWVYLFIPAFILFVLSLIFLILALCFKNYPHKLLNILTFAVFAIIPIIVQIAGIVVMRILAS